jgi:hypothetical protein
VVDLVVHTDPVVIIGILLSLALSITLDLTNAASGPESLLAGLMGITLSLVLDSIVRAERRFRIRSMLDAVPWFGESFFVIAERTTDIARRFPDSPILTEAQRRYEALQDDLEDLRRGRIIRPRSDHEYVLAAVRNSRRLIEASTNLVQRGTGLSTTSWWYTDLGRHYWELNVTAIQRGVRIVRIIAYLEMTDDIADLVAMHRAAGVEVGLLRSGSVDPALHRNFAIFDGSAAWEPQVNAYGEIVSNIFSINAQLVL